MNMAAPLTGCPVCASTITPSVRRRRNCALARCTACGLTFRWPMPTEAEIAGYYREGYHDYWQEPAIFKAVCTMKTRTAQAYLEQIRHVAPQGPLLDIGCSYGHLLTVAGRMGYAPVGVELSPEAVAYARRSGLHIIDKPVDQAGFTEGSFAVITLIDLIEHIAAPVAFLRGVVKFLAPGGVLFVVTPDVSSLAAQVLGNGWSHYQREHLCYYTPAAMRVLMETCGVNIEQAGGGTKVLTPAYIMNHFRVFTGGTPGRVAAAMERCLPKAVLNQPLRFRTGMAVLGRRKSDDGGRKSYVQ